MLQTLPPRRAVAARLRPARRVVTRVQRHLATYLDDQLPPPVPPGIAGLQHSTISLPTGHLDLTHPRDAMHLIFEQNFGACGTDPPYWAQPCTGQIWIADQARPPARDFLTACRRWATITTARTANPDVTIHQLRPRPTAATLTNPRSLVHP